MRKVVVALALSAGCSFSGSGSSIDGGSGAPVGDGANGGGDGTTSDDGTPPPGDGSQSTTGDAPADPMTLHLAPNDGKPGTAGLVLTGAVTINTSTGTPTISVSLPSGDTLDVKPQIGGGNLAVLRVSTLTIATGATVSITGDKPLVIIASGAIDVHGKLDAGGHGQTPGPAGAGPGMGTKPGTAGGHDDGSESDTGGGGGGYGTGGEDSGAITGCTLPQKNPPPGAGGVMYGDATISKLLGGSGGGASSGKACLPVDPGGAGGGALQLTSGTSIAIESDGSVLAGGGGGHGSTDCNAGNGDVNSGAGGGAGGTIVLQAPAVTNGGTVAANGGGGGGSSQTGGGNANPGNDGVAGGVVALGGTGPRAMGGSGGYAAIAPTQGGGAACGSNSAGGGGAVGRIAVSSGYAGGGITSPPANTSLAP